LTQAIDVRRLDGWNGWKVHDAPGSHPYTCYLLLTRSTEDAGAEVGAEVGFTLGDVVGREVGFTLGDVVGREVGFTLGAVVGAMDGPDVGPAVGGEVGLTVGAVASPTTQHKGRKGCHCHFLCTSTT